MRELPQTRPLRLTRKEKELIDKLLPMLRKEPPKNGRQDLILITRTQYYIGLSEATPRGRVKS
jgi:hypothetical protein